MATAPNRDPWITALSHLPSSKSVNASPTIIVASRDQVTAFEEMSDANPAGEETSTTRLEPTILAEEMGGEIATLAINEPGSILAIGEQASWEIERGRNIISHFFSCINVMITPYMLSLITVHQPIIVWHSFSALASQTWLLSLKRSENGRIRDVLHVLTLEIPSPFGLVFTAAFELVTLGKRGLKVWGKREESLAASEGDWACVKEETWPFKSHYPVSAFG